MTQIARSAVFIGFDPLCRANRLDPLAVLERCGLSPELLQRRDLYVPYTRFGQALTLAAERSGNPLFGLHLSRWHDYLILGPFGLLLAQAESFPEVLRLTRNYVHLHAQGIEMSAVEQGERLELRYSLNLREHIDGRQLLELGLGVMHRSLGSLFGKAWRPSRLEIRHEAQAPLGEYEQFFGCEVRFGQPRNAFIAASELLRCRPLAQRGSLASYLGSEQTDPVSQLRFVLQSILTTGEISLPVAARLLGQHPRVLQKTLRASGTCFRTLLDEVRYEEACQQLRQSGQSITELALHLGYGDETAFSRAFRRWSGVSPQAWRQGS
jgi:AraC-like DNA-binding protein